MNRNSIHLGRRRNRRKSPRIATGRAKRRPLRSPPRRRRGRTRTTTTTGKKRKASGPRWVGSGRLQFSGPNDDHLIVDFSHHSGRFRFNTQWCKFLSQEVRANASLLLREFPLSVCASFTSEFQIISHNCTPLSIMYSAKCCKISRNYFPSIVELPMYGFNAPRRSTGGCAARPSPRSPS